MLVLKFFGKSRTSLSTRGGRVHTFSSLRWWKAWTQTPPTRVTASRVTAHGTQQARVTAHGTQQVPHHLRVGCPNFAEMLQCGTSKFSEWIQAITCRSIGEDCIQLEQIGPWDASQHAHPSFPILPRQSHCPRCCIQASSPIKRRI